MNTPAANQHGLRPVPDGTEPQPLKVFCGHCGRAPENQQTVENPSARVCQKCGMGLLLQAPADAAPSPTDPFMVIDSSLTVCAVSKRAEHLLNINETDAVNRPIGEFLVPGDAETAPNENLAALVTWAARGDAPQRDVVVRPTNTFGVRYWARIGPCGPPTAALLVLADAR